MPKQPRTEQEQAEREAEGEAMPDDLCARLGRLFTVTPYEAGPPYYVTLADPPRRELLSVFADNELDAALAWRELIVDALASALGEKP